MSLNTGLVFVDLSNLTTQKAVETLISKALPLLPEGRSLVALWQVQTGCSPQAPIESWATQAALGLPSERTESSLEFFGNGVVRTYRVRQTSPSSVWYWLCFRRSGEKTYKRRKSAHPDVIKSSSLKTLAPVFTRDAANNVWHIPHRNSKRFIRERFQALLTWSDESTIEVRLNDKIRFARTQIAFSDGLIGKAVKSDYFWEPFSLPTSSD